MSDMKQKLPSKKRRIVIILSISIVAVLALICCLYHLRQENKRLVQIVNIEPSSSSQNDLTDPMQISLKQYLLIEGERYNLIKTYVNTDLALAYVKSEAPDIITLLQNYYSLPEFDQTTCEEYLANGYEYLSQPESEIIEFTQKMSEQFTLLQTFVSSYLVEKSNREIIDYVENKWINVRHLKMMLPEKPPVSDD